MSAEDRREQVLKAAMAEFAIHGLDGTSTEAIAERAGISQPYIFRLWPNKKDLFLATVDACFDRFEAVLKNTAEGRADADIGAQLQSARHGACVHAAAFQARGPPDADAGLRRVLGR